MVIDPEVVRLRAVLAEIERICYVPTPRGTGAYTHFMRDFDKIRGICRKELSAEQGQSNV